jgi:hypothetical protein
VISKSDIIHVGETNYGTLIQIFANPVSLDFSWDNVESLMQALGVMVRPKAERKILEYPDPWSLELRRAVVQLRYSQQQVHAGQARAIKQFLKGVALTPSRIQP